MIMRLESTILVCFVFCTGIGRLSTAFSVSTMSMAQQTVSSSSSSSSSSSLLLPLPLSLNVQQTLDPCVIVMKRMIAEYSHLWEDKGGVLSLAQGVVYWDPPPTVQEALSEALLDPLLHTYCPDEGLPELKSAVETKLAMENGLHHHRALITIGANQAYMNVVLTLLAGHKAIVFRPYYFNHVMAIQLVAGDDHVVIGPCTNDDDGVPDANWLNDYLDQADSTVSMVTITNPGNPTGVSLSRDQLREYVQITKKHNVWLVLDCTYEHFDHLHGSETFECFEDEHIIHIFSFSKGYAMAGFRCGYVVLHEKSTNAYSQMRKVQDTIPICPPRISQWAALGALRVPRQWVLNQIQTLDPSREHLLSALSCLSQVMGGSGAMYIMGKLPDGMNDKDTCETLVKEYGIAIIPGSFCGFPGWIRVCYSNLRPDKCMEAAARLKQGLEHLCIGKVTGIS